MCQWMKEPFVEAGAAATKPGHALSLDRQCAAAMSSPGRADAQAK
jgi:hypothetical protein